MDANFQQFLLLDAVLENWDGIQVRMGDLTPALAAALAQVAAELAAATEPGAVAVALDRLLDLTADTAAHDYVRQLVRRSALPESAVTRGAIGEKALATFDPAGVIRASSDLAAQAATAVAFDPVPVFFVTNRRREPHRPWDERFTGEYAGDVSYGLVIATIPRRTHRVGRVERPLALIGRENPARHVVIGDGELFGRDNFASALGRAVTSAPQKELLIFLHGYRVTFEEAARRAAQVASDLRFEGVVMLFSWPSLGSVLGYQADEDSAAKSAEPLRVLLRDLEGGPWTRVHVVAHSMGNRVMVGSLAGRDQGWTLPIQNVVLVAADIDVELFEQQFPPLREAVRQHDGALVTSYTSSTDRALGVSSFLHRTTRLGRVGDRPAAVDGLESVDATAMDTSLLGLHHSYFAEQRSLLTDLGMLVRERLPAGRRGLVSVDGKWWAFPR